MFVTVKHMGVVPLKHFRGNRPRNDVAHLFLGRPEVTQVDHFAVDICPNGVFRQIDIYSTRQGVGYDQRGRSQEAGTHLWMDTPFKITVATQHRRNYKIVLLHCVGNWLRQWAAITNAIVDRYCACYESMEIVHRQVEHRPPACGPSFHHLERECRQRVRFLLYTVALCSLCIRTRAQRRKPLARADLAEQLDRRREAAGISMQWLELTCRRLW